MNPPGLHGESNTPERYGHSGGSDTTGWRELDGLDYTSTEW